MNMPKIFPKPGVPNPKGHGLVWEMGHESSVQACKTIPSPPLAATTAAGLQTQKGWGLLPERNS